MTAGFSSLVYRLHARHINRHASLGRSFCAVPAQRLLLVHPQRQRLELSLGSGLHLVRLLLIRHAQPRRHQTPAQPVLSNVRSLLERRTFLFRLFGMRRLQHDPALYGLRRHLRRTVDSRLRAGKYFLSSHMSSLIN